MTSSPSSDPDANHLIRNLDETSFCSFSMDDSTTWKLKTVQTSEFDVDEEAGVGPASPDIHVTASPSVDLPKNDNQSQLLDLSLIDLNMPVMDNTQTTFSPIINTELASSDWQDNGHDDAFVLYPSTLDDLLDIAPKLDSEPPRETLLLAGGGEDVLLTPKLRSPLVSASNLPDFDFTAPKHKTSPSLAPLVQRFNTLSEPSDINGTSINLKTYSPRMVSSRSTELLKSNQPLLSRKSSSVALGRTSVSQKAAGLPSPPSTTRIPSIAKARPRPALSLRLPRPVSTYGEHFQSAAQVIPSSDKQQSLGASTRINASQVVPERAAGSTLQATPPVSPRHADCMGNTKLPLGTRLAGPTSPTISSYLKTKEKINHQPSPRSRASTLSSISSRSSGRRPMSQSPTTSRYVTGDINNIESRIFGHTGSETSASTPEKDDNTKIAPDSYPRSGHRSVQVSPPKPVSNNTSRYVGLGLSLITDEREDLITPSASHNPQMMKPISIREECIQVGRELQEVMKADRECFSLLRTCIDEFDRGQMVKEALFQRVETLLHQVEHAPDSTEFLYDRFVQVVETEVPDA